jgi:hypothetical protein
MTFVLTPEMQLSTALNYSIQHLRLMNCTNFTACVLKPYIHPMITTDIYNVISWYTHTHTHTHLYIYIYIYCVFTALLSCFYMIQNVDKIPYITLPPMLQQTLALKCFIPTSHNQKLNMPPTKDNLPNTLHFGAFGKSTIYCKGWCQLRKNISIIHKK